VAQLLVIRPTILATCRAGRRLIDRSAADRGKARPTQRLVEWDIGRSQIGMNDAYKDSACAALKTAEFSGV
jgi:hypothetical protein